METANDNGRTTYFMSIAVCVALGLYNYSCCGTLLHTATSTNALLSIQIGKVRPEPYFGGQSRVLAAVSNLFHGT